MIIGVPKEIKDGETRAGILPEGVYELSKILGVKVIVGKGLGENIGVSDKEYKKAGATVSLAKDVWRYADLIVKVKEPLPSEIVYLEERQTVFTFLHLASPTDEQTKLVDALLRKKITGIDYGTVVTRGGDMPIQKPMSEIAGLLAIDIGADLLRKDRGGRGILLTRITGVNPHIVVVVGAGVVGTAAAKQALVRGANTFVFDISEEKIRRFQIEIGLKNNLLCSEVLSGVGDYAFLSEIVGDTDLLVGATLVPGATAEKVVTKKMVGGMKDGAVVVDVSIDQGGCVATSRLMSHKNPTYNYKGRRGTVIHYGVPNMPALVGRDASEALTSASLPYVLEIARFGVLDTITKNEDLALGVNVFDGHVTNKGLAASQNREFVSLKKLLKIVNEN